MNRRHFIATVSLAALLTACGTDTQLPAIPRGATVLAFGDSVTFGTGAAEGEDWPTLLAAKTGWEIINAGIPGDTAEAGKARIAPLLGTMGSDVTHCGEVGCGQVVKLINNTLLFEQVAALAEMMVVAERAGVTNDKLIEAVGLGSGNSFALQNHARKAMAPREFPTRAFPSPYVLKDLAYAIELAGEVGVEPRMANRAAEYYQAAVDQGIGDKYFPAIIEVVDKGSNP